MAYNTQDRNFTKKIWKKWNEIRYYGRL